MGCTTLLAESGACSRTRAGRSPLLALALSWRGAGLVISRRRIADRFADASDLLVESDGSVLVFI